MVRKAGSEAPAGPTKAGRIDRYGRLTLSIGRHPSDLIRIAVAALVVLGCRVIAAGGDINPVEAAIASQFQRLPSWLAPAWNIVTWTGWWPGIAVAVAVALYLGRLRVGVALALAGVTSWLLALAIQWTVPARTIPSDLRASFHRVATGAFPFPDPRSAVIAALVVVAGPFVTRPVRNAGRVLVVLVAAGQVFLGRQLPVDVFAGVVLGWGVGTLFHLLLGAPGRRTSESAIHLALDQVGLEGTRILSAASGRGRPTEYELVAPDGARLRMTVAHGLRRRAGLVNQVRRMLASLEVPRDVKLSTPRHEIEHEAYVTLLAERAGVGTLPVVLAGTIEHGPPFLIQRRVEGRRLSAFSGGEVDDGLLDALWRDVRTLATIHVRHQDLRADNLLVDTEGRPRIISFALSSVGGPDELYWQETAEMLVTLAGVVGVDRAVDSAARNVPLATLRGALLSLQPLALRGRLRRQLEARGVTLSRLRERLAQRIEAPVPPFRLPVRPGSLAILLIGGLGIYLLLPQLASMNEVLPLLTRGDRLWFAAVLVAGFLAIFSSAISILGSSPVHLPAWRTIAVQIAAAFTGRTTAAGIGFYRINYVFLERAGLSAGHAAAGVALNRIVTGIVNGTATALGIVVIGTAVPISTAGLVGMWPVAVVVGVLLLAVVAFLASPYGRRRFVRKHAPQVREIVTDLARMLRTPVRAVQLIGGCIGYLVLSALAFAATLAAFTPAFPLVPVLAVFAVASTLGQLAPTPGGLGAVEAAMVAGLTALGVSPSHAVATVLASRVLTYWLPVLPGIVAFRILQRRGVV